MTQMPAMIGPAPKTEAVLLIPGCHEKGLPGNMFYQRRNAKDEPKNGAKERWRKRFCRNVQCDVPAAPADGEALK